MRRLYKVQNRGVVKRMIFDISRLLVPFMIIGVIAIGEVIIVFLIWLNNKLDTRKKKWRITRQGKDVKTLERITI